MIIPKPYFSPQRDAIEHLTGYSYDRTVPLIFSGRNFRKGVYFSKTEIIDIAPTLSAIFGIIPPALSEGRILSDILKVK